MRNWSKATSATATVSGSTAARARHRNGHAFRCTHHRARVGQRPAQVLRQQHLRDAQPARGLCAAAGVRDFVFSSTAAVYGMPAAGEADEETPTAPINPYGMSKLMSEHDAARSLRHQRHAPCDPALFQRRRVRSAGTHRPVSTPNATLLIKVACEHAVGKRHATLGVRHRLRDSRRHLHTRLHPCRRPGCRASARARLSADGRRVDSRSTADMDTATACAKSSMPSSGSAACALNVVGAATRGRSAGAGCPQRTSEVGARLAAATRRPRLHRAHRA